MKKTSSNKTYYMVLSAMFLALALVLPFLTGQMQQIGRALNPMHIPVILCGFFCGPLYGFAVGLIAPLLRFFFFGMPPIMPCGIGMSLELATYGLVSGLLYSKLPRKRSSVYISLLIAMVAGRVVWGIARVVFYGLGVCEFGWEAFIAGALLDAIPGIIVQIVLIPIIVIALKRYTIND